MDLNRSHVDAALKSLVGIGVILPALKSSRIDSSILNEDQSTCFTTNMHGGSWLAIALQARIRGANHEGTIACPSSAFLALASLSFIRSSPTPVLILPFS